jgi:hypothetical protein
MAGDGDAGVDGFMGLNCRDKWAEPISNFQRLQPMGWRRRRAFWNLSKHVQVHLCRLVSRSRTLPRSLHSNVAWLVAATATELVRKGYTLLLLDVPQRTLFGIDTQVGPILPPTTQSTSAVRACVKRLTGFRLRLLPMLLQVFSVGPKFKGMKMVPPGPHFVYYCSSSRYQYENICEPCSPHLTTCEPTVIRKCGGFGWSLCK